MLKQTKTLYLLVYFIISFYFMEIIFRMGIGSELLPIDFMISLFFSIAFAVALYIISTFFKSKTNYILSSIVLGLFGLIFSSQLVYNKIFRTFYSLYSAGKATQVLEFWKDILLVIIKNAGWIIILFLPCILIIVFGKRFLSFNRINKFNRAILICCVVISHILGLAGVYSSGRLQNSAYNLYFESSYPNLSVKRLGLLTTMRLDLQRLVTGWSPSLKPSATYTPIPSHDRRSHDRPSRDEIEKEVHDEIEEIIEKVEVEYNIMDIDFEKLISNEANDTIKEMHEYFNTQLPTEKNEYTERFKGYNLIFITAESFSPYAVHKDVTPTLYKLVNKGYRFTNFYNPLWGVSTSDGEYVACTGLLPKHGVWSMYKSGSNSLPFTMGNQLEKLGYKTLAYHNHSYNYYRRDISHPNLGYVYKGLGNGLDVKKTWPESDLEMMEKTVSEYIDNDPFHVYYLTVSGHMQYNFFGNAMAIKNKELVKDLPYSQEAKAYLATHIELDRALQYLLEQLENAGVADKTLIVMSADHYPYGLEFSTIDEFAGHPVEKNFELYKSNLIIYTEGIEPVTIDKPCSSLDIIPTISNLLGLEYDSRLLMGNDIFSDSKPFVVFLNKSFITDKGKYNAETGKFSPNEGIEIDDEYINSISDIVNLKFYYSAKVLETDYYKIVLESQ